MILISFPEPILEIFYGAVNNLNKTMEHEDGNITGQSSHQSVQNYRRRNGNKISRTVLQLKRYNENHKNG